MPMVREEVITWSELKAMLEIAGVEDCLDNGMIHLDFLNLATEYDEVNVEAIY